MSENQLGENIARYRKERGLSQKKMAEYMGVSRQAVTKWERNLSKPAIFANLFFICNQASFFQRDCRFR